MAVDAQQWGRVDAEGTVWVRSADGERAVGQYPGATEEEALAYFTRKYDDLVAQVALLEQRIKAQQVSGAEAEAGVRRLAEALGTANAVGDLGSLATRIEALQPLAQQRKADAEKAKQEARARAVADRAVIVEEAEAIASTPTERIPWKTSGDRLRDLFELWRKLQRDSRLDKQTEDELWKRFSHARTAFDRKRRQHFGALDEQRGQAKAFKEKIVAEAEALSTSTDWGATAGAYRDLMTQWKTSGRASRKDDDQLWARFRAAQETFFSARNEATAQTDAEFRDNLTLKEALLVEAEALLPVGNVQEARSALRDIQDRWEAAGRVPRADLTRIEGRLRAVEHAVRDAEQDRWRRSNPEARARAQDVVSQLENVLSSLTKQLEKARSSGNQRKITEIEQSIAARNEWLEQARKALEEFSG